MPCIALWFIVFVSRAMKNLTVILSLENNKKNGLEKAWKKSWILSSKKCANPVYKQIHGCAIGSPISQPGGGEFVQEAIEEVAIDTWNTT